MLANLRLVVDEHHFRLIGPELSMFLSFLLPHLTRSHVVPGQALGGADEAADALLRDAPGGVVVAGGRELVLAPGEIRGDRRQVGGREGALREGRVEIRRR